MVLVSWLNCQVSEGRVRAGATYHSDRRYQNDGERDEGTTLAESDLCEVVWVAYRCVALEITSMMIPIVVNQNIGPPTCVGMTHVV